MTDSALCTAVKTIYPSLPAFERHIVALATLRVLRGEALKPHQRDALLKMLRPQARVP